MASGLTTLSSGWPSNSFLIGSSCFLPLRVRGTSGTCTMASGTKRGDRAWRMAALMRFFRPSSSTSARAQHHKQRHEALAAQVLQVHHQASSTSGRASTAA
jgi:hypothetical protein